MRCELNCVLRATCSLTTSSIAYLLAIRAAQLLRLFDIVRVFFSFFFYLFHCCIATLLIRYVCLLHVTFSVCATSNLLLQRQTTFHQLTCFSRFCSVVNCLSKMKVFFFFMRRFRHVTCAEKAGVFFFFFNAAVKSTDFFFFLLCIRRSFR